MLLANSYQRSNLFQILIKFWVNIQFQCKHWIHFKTNGRRTQLVSVFYNHNPLDSSDCIDFYSKHLLETRHSWSVRQMQGNWGHISIFRENWIEPKVQNEVQNEKRLNNGSDLRFKQSICEYFQRTNGILGLSAWPRQ